MTRETRILIALARLGRATAREIVDHVNAQHSRQLEDSGMLHVLRRLGFEGKVTYALDPKDKNGNRVRRHELTEAGRRDAIDRVQQIRAEIGDLVRQQEYLHR